MNTYHHIRDGRFECDAPATAPCHNYPACGCEAWTQELHDPPAPGHEDVPQAECWVTPWIDATDLSNTYDDGEGETWFFDDEFPDGPVIHEWHGDYLTWRYADATTPRSTDDEGDA